MGDPWIGVLQAITPEYDKLVSMMNKGPYIKPDVWKNSHGKWAVTLNEVWDDATVSDVSISLNFDKSVTWAEEELKKWDCNRTSYDTWVFKTKQDAEKFRTLFLLQWPT